MPTDPPAEDQVTLFKQRCVANLLDMIKGVKVQAILYVPAKEVDPATRAYIHSELSGIAKLYEMEAKL